MEHGDPDSEALWLEWEDSTRPLEVSIHSPGNLPPEFEVVRVSRAEDLSLQVTATTARRVSSVRHATQAGELLPDPPAVTGTTFYESVITLEGVWVAEEKWSSHSGSSIRANAHSVREVRKGDAAASWHSEWLVNYSSNDLVHPRRTRRSWVRQFTRERDEQKPLNVDLSPVDFGSSHDHVHLVVPSQGGQRTIRVGSAHASDYWKRFRPGFMEFDCDGPSPSEAQKAAILDALSFALGRRVLSVGGSTFDAKGRLLSTEMRHSALLRHHGLIESPSMPPAPLGDGHVVDEVRLQKLVSAVLERLEKYNLRHSLMLAWAAPLGFIEQTVVGLAAAIEALRDATSTVQPAVVDATGILPAQTWQAVADALLERFDSVTGWRTLEKKSRELSSVRSKLLQLNTKGTRQRYGDFFNAIGLPIGEVELESLRRRNLPAHGYELNDSQVGALFLTGQTLRTLFNRIVLKLTGGADEYIDYSTYGHPVRSLDVALGGPKGDGRPGAFG